MSLLLPGEVFRQELHSGSHCHRLRDRMLRLPLRSDHAALDSVNAEKVLFGETEMSVTDSRLPFVARTRGVEVGGCR
jgi:hypothetical protein